MNTSDYITRSTEKAAGYKNSNAPQRHIVNIFHILLKYLDVFGEHQTFPSFRCRKCIAITFA